MVAEVGKGVHCDWWTLGCRDRCCVGASIAVGELYPRVGFIVTNLKRPAERVSKFYNGRGTAEQWIRGGQAGAALDAAVLPRLPPQRRAAPALRPGLQPRQLPALAGAAQGGRALVADHACARSWSRSAPGSCGMAATSSSSSPRWRCRGRCSPRSCVGSADCVDRPCRRHDGRQPDDVCDRRESHASEPGRTCGNQLSGAWKRLQSLPTVRIAASGTLPVDRRVSGRHRRSRRRWSSGESPLNRFREAHRQEREERLFANRRVARVPVSAEPLARVSVEGLDFRWPDALDFGARPDEAA